MADLAFEVIQGPNVGQQILIGVGYKLGNGTGNAQTEINFPGKNILNLHAQIVAGEDNQLVLTALNPNRAFYVDSKKTRKVVLTVGQIFKMEDVIIKVISAKIRENGPPIEAINQPKLDKQSLNYKITDALPLDTEQFLNGSLDGLLKKCISFVPKNSEKLSRVKPFKNPLQLRIIQGVQFEESFIIGWGPRKFGKNTFEFSLLDPVTPDVAFTLSPGSNGEYIFSTHHPKIVFINGQKVKKTIVHSGDKIKFGDTVVEILELEYF
jgi:hypothetical protein